MSAAATDATQTAPGPALVALTQRLNTRAHELATGSQMDRALAWEQLSDATYDDALLPDDFDPETYARSQEGGVVVPVLAGDLALQLLDAWVSPCDATRIRTHGPPARFPIGLTFLPALSIGLFLRVREMVRGMALPTTHTHDAVDLTLPEVNDALTVIPELQRVFGSAAVAVSAAEATPAPKMRSTRVVAQERRPPGAYVRISGARAAVWFELLVAGTVATSAATGRDVKPLRIHTRNADEIVKLVRSDPEAMIGADPTLYRISDSVRARLGLPRRCFMILCSAVNAVCNATLHVDVIPLGHTKYALARCHTALHCERLKAICCFQPTHIVAEHREAGLPFEYRQACAYTCLLSLSHSHDKCGSAMRIEAQRAQGVPVVLALDSVITRAKDDAFAVAVEGDRLRLTSYIVTPFKAAQLSPQTTPFDDAIFATAMKNGDDHYDGNGRVPMLPAYAKTGTFSRAHRTAGPDKRCCCAVTREVRGAAVATRYFDVATGDPVDAPEGTGTNSRVTLVENTWLDDELVFPFLMYWHLLLRINPHLRGEGAPRAPCGLTAAQQASIRLLLRAGLKCATMISSHNADVIQFGHAVSDFFTHRIDGPKSECGFDSFSVDVSREQFKQGFLYRSELITPHAKVLDRMSQLILRVTKSPMKEAVRETCARNWGLHVVSLPSVAHGDRVATNRVMIEMLRARHRNPPPLRANGRRLGPSLRPPVAAVPPGLASTCDAQVRDHVLKLWEMYVTAPQPPSDAAITSLQDADIDALGAAAMIEVDWLRACASALMNRQETAPTIQAAATSDLGTTPTSSAAGASNGAPAALLLGSCGAKRLLAAAAFDEARLAPLLTVPILDVLSVDAATRRRHATSLVPPHTFDDSEGHDLVRDASMGRLQCSWDGTRPMRTQVDLTAQFLALRVGPTDAVQFLAARAWIAKVVDRAAASTSAKEAEDAFRLGSFLSDPYIAPRQRVVPLFARAGAPSDNGAVVHTSVLGEAPIRVARAAPRPGAAALGCVSPYSAVQMLARTVPAHDAASHAALAAAVPLMQLRADAAAAMPAHASCFLVLTEQVAVRPSPTADAVYEFVTLPTPPPVGAVTQSNPPPPSPPSHRVAFVEFVLVPPPTADADDGGISFSQLPRLSGDAAAGLNVPLSQLALLLGF